MTRHYENVFVDDLENDEALALCEDESKWFWVRMFLYMACKSPHYGRLLTKAGTRPELDDLCKMFREKRSKVIRILADLEKNNVFNRDEKGVIFCRCQVRRAEVSASRKLAADKRWSENSVEHVVENLQCKAPCKVDANDHANGHANAGNGYGSDLISEKEGVQREEPSTAPVSPLKVFIDAFNAGGAGKIDPAAQPSGRTKKRDAMLREAVKTFDKPDDWRWCAAALAVSDGHNGLATGFRASLPWLLERGKGAKLEDWMNKGARLRDGTLAPTRSERHQDARSRPEPTPSRDTRSESVKRIQEEMRRKALEEEKERRRHEEELAAAEQSSTESGRWLLPRDRAGMTRWRDGGGEA